MQLPEQVHKAKLLAPSKWQGAPKNGVVAVKVQYPDGLQTMLQDLSNVRVAANFLQAREAANHMLLRSWARLDSSMLDLLSVMFVLAYIKGQLEEHKA